MTNEVCIIGAGSSGIVAAKTLKHEGIPYARFEGKRMHFVDGSSEEIDVIVYATGYHINFPFLPEKVLNVHDNDLSLYHYVVHPECEGLYFIGLVKPLGPVMPLAELQSK